MRTQNRNARRMLWPAVPALMLAGCAVNTGPARESAYAEVEGKAIGKPVACVQMRNIERVEAANKYVALFHMRGERVYRNDLPSSCPRLGRDALLHKTATSNYCRGDIITVFDPVSGITGGSCLLGSFVPYELTERDRDDSAG